MFLMNDAIHGSYTMTSLYHIITNTPTYTWSKEYDTHLYKPVQMPFAYFRGPVRALEVNNNPFEYWLAHDDASYVDLMVAVEACLSCPGPCDRAVGELFTEQMFQELTALMREQEIAGAEEVATLWPGLRERRAVSGFIKDKSLGAKRLISMPDRVTNTIQVVTRKASEYKPPPACRPTAGGQ